MKPANSYLRELYLDWINNYMSVSVIAEHHNIDIDTMVILLSKGKTLHEDYIRTMRHGSAWDNASRVTYTLNYSAWDSFL